MAAENDVLIEIVHIAAAALVADLTSVKRQALGDIAQACAAAIARGERR